MNNLDFSHLLVKQGFWSKIGPYNDITLSSRVRLVRNIYGIPFSHRQEMHDIELIRCVAEKFIKDSGFSGLELLEINSMDYNNKRFLRERNIISHNMEIMNNCFVILCDNEDFIIMINDEDHFKIQTIKPGFQLLEAYRLSDKVDSELNTFAIYAFSEDIGFITSNPSNSGIEVLIMLHLPVLSFTKRITEVQDIIKLSGLNIDGLKEEGVKTFGGMFVLSNNFSKRIPEKEITEEFEDITHKIISLESEARENYFSEHGIRLEDRIGRSYGLLKYARKIGYVESMDYLSDIRLGVILSIIKNIELQKINDLMINMQWSHMQVIANKIFNGTSEGDIFRAAYLRDQLERSTLYG